MLRDVLKICGNHLFIQTKAIFKFSLNFHVTWDTVSVTYIAFCPVVGAIRSEVVTRYSQLILLNTIPLQGYFLINLFSSVYILNSEGHKGVGFDLRRRGIWDWFPTKPELREEPIIPGVETRFPGIDWILGNHSDELTPWIPVFACLSGLYYHDNHHYFYLGSYLNIILGYIPCQV